MKITYARAAVEAYFSRIKSGEATEAEYAILPQMLDRLDIDTSGRLTADDIERFDGMSEAGRRGDFPTEGLVSAAEAAEFVGKRGLKKPAEGLSKLARDGRFPKPVRVGNKDMWDIAELRRWIGGLADGDAVRRRSADRARVSNTGRGMYSGQDRRAV